MGSVKYQAYQTNVLPSEARHATWQSGALPSDIRMNARATGPLAPSGALAYVPGPSPVQQAMNMPPPNQPAPSPYQINAALYSGPAATPGYGSVRYSSHANAVPGSVAAAPPAPAPRPAANVAVGTNAPAVPNVPAQPVTPPPSSLSPANPQLQVGPSTPGARILSQSTLQVGSVKYGDK
jgi:hypothetical protein